MTRADVERIAAAVVADVFSPDALPVSEETHAAELQAAIYRDCGLVLYDTHARALVRAGWRAR
jgi:hypothetical protein